MPQAVGESFGEVAAALSRVPAVVGESLSGQAPQAVPALFAAQADLIRETAEATATATRRAADALAGPPVPLPGRFTRPGSVPSPAPRRRGVGRETAPPPAVLSRGRLRRSGAVRTSSLIASASCGRAKW